MSAELMRSYLDLMNEKRQNITEGTDDFSRNVEAFRVYQHLDPMEFYKFASTPQGLKTLAQKAGTTPESVKDSLERLDWGQFPDEFYQDDEEQGITETSDYSRRREREEAIISGKKPARKKAPAQTSDYARRREQEKKAGVAEGHADQQRTIVKRNGQPVGEIGIDRESSPGVGQYYMKHYASGTDNSGYDSREEALGDLRHIMKQSVYGELQGQGVRAGRKR